MFNLHAVTAGPSQHQPPVSDNLAITELITKLSQRLFFFPKINQHGTKLFVNQQNKIIMAKGFVLRMPFLRILEKS